MKSKVKPYDRTWEGGGAADFAARNPADLDAVNEEHAEAFGLTRTTMYGWFLRDIPKKASILEVGANTGVQLRLLEKLGYKNLSACDISGDVLAECPYPSRVADMRDLPYEDDSFDVVFTSGTLMAISFDDKAAAAWELARVSRRYILGFEYQAYEPTQKTYDRMPPGYLLPIERLWRVVLPNSVILRSDTWRGNDVQSTYVYLIDKMPLSKVPL